MKLVGEEQNVFDMLRAIWEISFLYEGYFYKPTKYLYDFKERKVKEYFNSRLETAIFTADH